MERGLYNRDLTMRLNAPLALLFVTGTTFAQQQPTHVEPALYVTAIDVVAQVQDASGNVPAGLKPEDFVILEEGVERRVIGVEYLQPEAVTVSAPVTAAPAVASVAAPRPEEWEIVLYFETQLSSGSSRKYVANALTKQIDQLVRLGRVDVILADPSPAPLVRGSRDPEAIRQALRRVMAIEGTNWLNRYRREYYNMVMMTASPVGGISMPASAVRPYIDDELQLIARFRTNLALWLGSYSRHVPRALFVASDGFDLDPVEFYAAALAPAEQVFLSSYVQQSQLGPSMDWLGQALAAGGWTTMGVPGWIDMGTWLDDTSVSGVGRAHAFVADTADVRSGTKSLVYRPLDPLHAMAEATGGDVVPNASRLARAIAGLGNRVKLTYQVGRPPDGKARKIEVRARRAGWKVRAMQWASSSTLEEMATKRALDLLTRRTPGGELQVTSAVDWDSSAGRRIGTIHGTAQLGPFMPIFRKDVPSAFRVTFAVHVPPKDAFVVTRFVTDADVSSGTFRYRAALDFPAAASLLVVTVEEVSTGIWGSARVVIR
jgi:hypothetical protein